MYVSGLAADEVHTVPEFDLGQLGASASDGTKIYQYVQANGAMAVNKVAQIQANYQAVVSTTEQIGASLGVTKVAFADNDYGWVQVFGQARVRTGQSFTTAQALHVNLDTGEAGDLQRGTAATPEILGMYYTASVTDNTNGTVQMSFPILRA